MITIRKLTVERLLELLSYDPVTGVFTWKVNHWSSSAGSIAGCLNPGGYRHISIDGEISQAHRLAFLYVTGKWPIGYVDHIDRNPRNNSWANLREVNSVENSQNRSKRVDCKSGITGVDLLRSGAYRAQIQHKGVKHYLGTFSTVAEASAARQAANIRYGFHPNHGK